MSAAVSAARARSLGIIAFAPEGEWSTAEYAGHILHECVHQILFLHDMMFGMFDVHGGNMAEPAALVKSTILKRPRLTIERFTRRSWRTRSPASGGASSAPT
jgi:hypothetical protein